MEEIHEIRVGGRLCLLGEHTDWASSVTSVCGAALTVGLQQGMSARVRKLNTPVLLLRLSTKGEEDQQIQLPLSLTALAEYAHKEEFFSYVVGTAYCVLRHIHSCQTSSCSSCSFCSASAVTPSTTCTSSSNDFLPYGISIEIYDIDLPIRKGLSSSGAVCVLTAQAYNQAYSLGWETEKIMQIAYEGEREAGSQCGTLDQVCAYGERVILSEFSTDGEGKDKREEVHVEGGIEMIIVDLKRQKDTRKILSSLQEAACRESSNSEGRAAIVRYCKENAQLIDEAKRALEQGDARTLGEIMNRAQASFDLHLLPLCASELAAPALHNLLARAEVKEHCWGGKGVGAGGDGTAQLVAKTSSSAQAMTAILRSEEYDVYRVLIKRKC